MKETESNIVNTCDILSPIEALLAEGERCGLEEDVVVPDDDFQINC